jgi:hypothetical protein
MTRTPEQAIAWALGTQKGYAGMCLYFVRSAFGVPARYSAARTAWQQAARRHPTTDRAAIPRGVPVFLDHPKSTYGHVALALGDGRIRTTNSATGLIHTHDITLWQSWGYSLLGWTEDLNGVDVATTVLASSGGTTTGTVTAVPTLTAPTPLTPTWEDDMALSDEALDQIAARLQPVINAAVLAAAAVRVVDAGDKTYIVDHGTRVATHVGEHERDIALASGLPHILRQGADYLAGFTIK